MKIHSFFDEATATFTYLVVDEKTTHCAIIDPLLNYSPESGRTSTESADILLSFIEQKNLHVEWILETHIHADHVTGASYLKNKTGAKTGIGAKIVQVLEHWVPVFNTQNDTPMDGSQFDHLFADNEFFTIGSLQARVLFTPGHTPSCVTYLVEDAAFVGDTIFMPYVGTSRADFPGGDAKTLYSSIQKILSLPESTRVFTGHDYPPSGQKAAGESTVKQQKKSNVLINETISEQEYINKRRERDATLAVPRLILPSIQMNLRTGNAGKAESNHTHYVKIPLNIF